MTDRETLEALQKVLVYEYQHTPEGEAGHEASRLSALSEQVADAYTFVDNHLKGLSPTKGMFRSGEFTRSAGLSKASF